MLGVLHGWQSTAPVKAAEKFKMAQFLERIGWTWTPEQYRTVRAGDITFIREYWQMTAPGKVETADDG